MNSNLWQRAREVLLLAVDLEPDARQTFARSQCGADSELLQAVMTLLAGHEESAGVVDGLAEAQGVFGALRQQVRKYQPRGLQPGDAVDDFEVVQRLGQGGMATVYHARRRTDDFEQSVALKVLDHRHHSAAMVSRFDRERRMVALLDHPNIARLIDGGVTDDGRPYFAMELVDGLPIDVWCDHHQLSLRQRIRLVREVAAAVQHAHRNLLIHRDLKPSNILVDQSGRVRLLDFGIAKLLDGAGDSTDPTGSTLHTHTGATPLTPSHASPEQFQGEHVTTASDQYQLGLLLFELVTGHCHHLLEGRDPGSVGRRIVDLESPRPSTVLTDAETLDGPSRGAGHHPSAVAIARARNARLTDLARSVRGDLDTIILKTLEKSPDRRYPSVEAFSADLQRYLEHEPIRARPDHATYRARKFVRRNRLAVASATLAVSALVLGTGLATWQALRATRAERTAIEEAAAAGQVSDFLVELFESADPGRFGGREVTAREVLERGRRQLEFHAIDSPRVRGRLRATVAKIYHRLSDLETSEEISRENLSTLEQELGPDDPAVADALIVLADTLARTERFDAARAAFQRAFEIRQPLFGRRSVEAAQALNGVARCTGRLGDGVASERLHREVLEIHEELFGDRHELIAKSLYFVGSLEAANGSYTEAANTLTRAAEMDRLTVGEISAEYAEDLVMLGNVHWQQGHFAQAAEALGRASEISERIYGPDHYQSIRGLESTALVLIEMAEYERAEALIRRSLDSKRALFGERHQAVGGALHNLGFLLQDMGRYAEAEQVYRQAIAIRRVEMGRHQRVAELLENLGEVLLELDELDQAETLFNEALAIKEEVLPDGHTRLAWPHWGLGLVAHRRGELELAAQQIERARGYVLASHRDDHPELAFSLHALANVRRDQERSQEADLLYRRALELRAAVSRQRPLYHRTAEDYAQFLERTGRELEARAVRASVEAARGT